MTIAKCSFKDFRLVPNEQTFVIAYNLFHFALRKLSERFSKFESTMLYLYQNSNAI